MRNTFGKFGFTPKDSFGIDRSDETKLKALGLESDTKTLKVLQDTLKEQKRLAEAVAKERRKSIEEKGLKGGAALVVEQSATKYENISKKIDAFLSARIVDNKTANEAVKDLGRTLSILQELDRKNNEDLFKKVIQANVIDIKRITRSVEDLKEVVSKDVVVEKKKSEREKREKEKEIGKSARYDKERSSATAGSVARIGLSKVIGTPLTILLDKLIDFDKVAGSFTSFLNPKKALPKMFEGLKKGAGYLHQKAQGAYVRAMYTKGPDTQSSPNSFMQRAGDSIAASPMAMGLMGISKNFSDKIEEVKDTLLNIQKRNEFLDKVRDKLNSAKGFMGNGLSKLGGLAGRGIKAGASLLGKAAPLAMVGAAGFAGWQVGTKIYDKFNLEIADFMDGTVAKVEAFVSGVKNFFTKTKNFFTGLGDTAKSVIEDIKNSPLAKFFSKYFNFDDSASSMPQYTSNTLAFDASGKTRSASDMTGFVGNAFAKASGSTTVNKADLPLVYQQAQTAINTEGKQNNQPQPVSVSRSPSMDEIPMFVPETGLLVATIPSAFGQ